MSEVEQSMEKYNEPISEQAEYVAGSVSGSPQRTLSDHDRLRIVVAQLEGAERQIGSRRLGSLRERVHFILQQARAYGVTPRAYAVAWFIWRTTKPEHVIIDHAAIAGLSGEIA